MKRVLDAADGLLLEVSGQRHEVVSFNQGIRIAQDIVVLGRRGERIHDVCYRLGVPRQILVCYPGDAVVYVQVADEPVIVLKLLDVIKACREEEAKTSTSVDVLLSVHITATSRIGCF